MRAAFFLVAVLLVGTAQPAQARGEAKARAWVSGVVDRIEAAGVKQGDENSPGGSVTIRVRVASDGALDGVEIEQGSGFAALDQRALRAVRAAAPFRAPPRQLLTLEGYTELSFPLELPGRSVR